MLRIWDLNVWDVILYQDITGLSWDSWASWASGTVKIIEKHHNGQYSLIETDWSLWWKDNKIVLV